MWSLRTSLAVGALMMGAVVGTANAAPAARSALDVDTCNVDQFDGSTLNTTRWNEVVRPSTLGYRVEGGQLRIRALKGDLYGDRDTAQNIILQDTPDGAWTATTKLDSTAFNREGQQAGFVVRKDGRTFSKFVVINKGEQGRWFEHVFTNDQQPRIEIGTDTTPPLDSTFPALVYIRVVSDGDTIRGEYSGNGTTWSPIGRPAKIGGDVKVGVYAADNDQDGPEIPFDFVSLNAQSDEFDGTALEKCRWSSIVREDATGYRVADGKLEIDTGANEVDGTAPNLIGQPAPAGLWEAETKIDLATDAEGQQAGLLLYKANNNWVKVVLVNKGGSARQIELVRVKNGAYQLDAPFKVDVPTSLTSFLLRMRSSGSVVTAQYSADGTSWTDVGQARDISDLAGGQLGPMALRGGAATTVKAKFDYLRVRPSPAASCTANGTVENGFERLWNGIDLSQARQAGPGGFDVVNDGAEGCRLVSRGGLGLLWFPTKKYDDFVLRTQFKTSDDTDNSGIFVRFPDPGADPNVAIAQGHEIQIREGADNDSEPQKTGSIYTFKRETARAAKPAGQWNDYEIRYEDGKYTITLNGTVVNEWTNTSQQAKSPGFIGLQNHGTDDVVSFRNVRIQTLNDEQANLFDTIGITRQATRAASQIRGGYSFKGEEMPPSRSVGAAPNDAADDVPLRTPDTFGTVPNLAGFNGQTLTLREDQQKAYTKLHFFGTTADGSGSGTFTLRYSDNTTATVSVAFPDWCASATPAAHPAVGPQTGRWTDDGSDGARCSIFHHPSDNPQPGKTLVAITLPQSTTGSSDDARSYLMALTLEDANGLFEMPDLSGQVGFPNDKTAPVTEAAIDPDEADGDDGWFKRAVRVTLSATDEEGGSGVEQRMYRIDGGAPQNYTGPFDYAVEGEHTLEFRSVDGAGNAETYRSITLKVDPTAPTTTTTVTPGTPRGEDDWYDTAVRVRLNPGDGSGSGVKTTEYRLDGATEWTAYTAPFALDSAGAHTLQYRSADVAGNAEKVQTLTVRVDATAPTTSVQLNGAAPQERYTGPVRVTLTRDDGDGSGATETQYAIDDADEWTTYEGAFDITAVGGHVVAFRSVDGAGNVENYREVAFAISTPVAAVPAPVVPAAPIPQAGPAPAPKPFASLEPVARKYTTMSALRGGKVSVRVSCQAVDRGTLSLTVSRSVAKRLKLKSATLARGTVRCGAEGRGTFVIKPSAKVRRALAKTKSSITATLALRLQGSAGVAKDTQTVTFSRGKSS